MILRAATKQGVVEGVQNGSYTVFKGIPYAKPPVGELRFKAPQEPECWEGVRKADKFPARCIQFDAPQGSFYQKEFYFNTDFMPAQSEDCLYLNIWTPAKETSEKLPVAFWIHGGGFGGGFGSEIEFDGEAYCQQNVILVSINYRVGLWGFLGHSWFSAENEKGISGNYGIFDQIAALKWIYENIAAFGGDPDRITIFGQSAGSMSVQDLVSTDLTGNMIHSAIMQSGGGYDTGLSNDRTQEQNEELGKRFVEICGAKSPDELRAMPAKQLVEASDVFNNECMGHIIGLPFTPVIDGYLLKGQLIELADKGKFKKIPYMVGSTKNDIFVEKKLLEDVKKGKMYQGCVNWSLKNEELWRNPSYVYCFARDVDEKEGAFHSAELWYMFGTLKRSQRKITPEDERLSKAMVSYWCNFMKTGNPNGEGLAVWEPCTKQSPYVKIFE